MLKEIRMLFPLGNRGVRRFLGFINQSPCHNFEASRIIFYENVIKSANLSATIYGDFINFL